MWSSGAVIKRHSSVHFHCGSTGRLRAVAALLPVGCWLTLVSCWCCCWCWCCCCRYLECVAVCVPRASVCVPLFVYPRACVCVYVRACVCVSVCVCHLSIAACPRGARPSRTANALRSVSSRPPPPTSASCRQPQPMPTPTGRFLILAVLSVPRRVCAVLVK